MEHSELLFTRPESLLDLSEGDEKHWLDTMRHLSVVDAKTEATGTLEQIWKRSKRGTLFVWLRHFG